MLVRCSALVCGNGETHTEPVNSVDKALKDIQEGIHNPILHTC